MNFPRLIPIVLALTAAVSAVMAADEKVAAEIDVLRGSYQRTAKAALKASDDKYSAGLEALYKRYTQDAKLEAALQVRNEIALTKLGGIWKWNWTGGKNSGYLIVLKDQTAIETRSNEHGTWESTDKGIKIKWNKSIWEVMHPSAEGGTKAKDSNSDSFVLDREK